MGDRQRQRQAALPRAGRALPLVQVALQERQRLRDFVRDEVFPYMASLVKEEPQIAEYFRDAVLEIVDPNVLKQVMDEIDGIDFAKLGPDVKGDIFEYLLTHLGQSALNGQFRTPAPDPGHDGGDGGPRPRRHDLRPRLRHGGFLIDAVEHILAKYSDEPQEVPIYGEEWLEKRGQTLEEAKKEIPTLQTYRKGAGREDSRLGDARARPSTASTSRAR